MSDIVVCRICGNLDALSGTKLCDRCWELEGRMLANPKLALSVIASNPLTFGMTRPLVSCVRAAMKRLAK